MEKTFGPMNVYIHSFHVDHEVYREMSMVAGIDCPIGI